jgi:hypothetical protein
VDIIKLLPQNPLSGPPLPAGMNILWPWKNAGTSYVSSKRNNGHSKYGESPTEKCARLASAAGYEPEDIGAHECSELKCPGCEWRETLKTRRK